MNRYKKNEQKNQMMTTQSNSSSYPTTTTSNVSFSFEQHSSQVAESPREQIPFQGYQDPSSPHTAFPYSDNRNNGQPPPPSLSSTPQDSQRIAELEVELQAVQTERDDLMRERKFWLAKIQTDNTKLMHLLQVPPPSSISLNPSFTSSTIP